MGSQKTEWGVIQVKGHDLEDTLNSLATEDLDIFSVQFSGGTDWTIITRKSLKEDQRRGMGFKALGD